MQQLSVFFGCTVIPQMLFAFPSLSACLLLKVKRYFPVSSEISDLLFFIRYFASQNKGIQFGDYCFEVFCAN